MLTAKLQDRTTDTGTRTLAPVHVALTATGVLLAHGGYWPPGSAPWVVLAAIGLTATASFDLRAGSRAAGATRSRLLHAATPGTGVLAGLALAASVSSAVLAVTVLVATCTLAQRRMASKPGVGALFGALSLALTWLAGHVLASGAGSGPPPVSIYVLMFLSGTLGWSLAWLGARAQQPAASCPSSFRVTAILLGWWAVALLPIVPLSGASLVGRTVALAVVGLGGLGYLALLRFDALDRSAAQAVVRAGVQGGIAFAAAASALAWTTDAAVLGLALLVASSIVPLFYRDREGAWSPEPAAGVSLATGLSVLEDLALADATSADEREEELLRTRAELDTVRGELEGLRAARREAASATEGSESVEDGSVVQYERRIRKLVAALERTEAELARVARMKAVDPGQSSIYREVQGLDGRDPLHEQKAELMRAIFDANVALLAKT